MHKPPASLSQNLWGLFNDKIFHDIFLSNAPSLHLNLPMLQNSYEKMTPSKIAKITFKNPRFLTVLSLTQGFL